MRIDTCLRTLTSLAASAPLLWASAVQAQRLTTERVAVGLNGSLFVTAPPGDTQRLFIAVKDGQILILDLTKGEILPTPFIDIAVESFAEQGLLGLAFHPDYEQTGHFFVHYSRPGDGNTVVARYTVSDKDPNVADPNSAVQLFVIDQPHDNHNGGWIGFGPRDGYLYVAMGDGGSGDDPDDRAQNIDDLLGKMLRIDVNGDDFPEDPHNNYAIPPTNPFVGREGRDEIWALGLRNPWRCSFDRLTGDLYVGDVGQEAREEIDFQPGDSRGGENYGWKCEEGTICGDEPSRFCKCGDENLVPPILDLERSDARCISGGYVYRGSAIPALAGTYFFADYLTRRVWSLRYDGREVSEFTDRTEELSSPGYDLRALASFGEDARGEVYICSTRGEIYRIVAAGPACEDIRKLKADCNGRGRVNAVVRLKNKLYDGQSVTLAVGDEEYEVDIRGRKAKLKVCCSQGVVTVELRDPQECRPPVDVECP
ncbi:MAG: hypothetical protein C4547_10870 [Phycisphaerales bacterium]|nr:MAG: hypothetical protein C4547_10870 [Phycisphaerales bacterium]